MEIKMQALQDIKIEGPYSLIKSDNFAINTQGDFERRHI